MSGQAHSFKQPSAKEELHGVVDVNSKVTEMSRSWEGQMPVTEALHLKLRDGNKYGDIGIREMVLEKGHQLKEGIKDTLGLNDKGIGEKAQEWKESIKETLGFGEQDDHEINEKGFEYGGGRLPGRANPRDELRGMVNVNDMRNRMHRSNMGQISVEESLRMKYVDAVQGRRRYADASLAEVLKEKVAGFTEGLKETLGLKPEIVKKHELGGGKIPRRPDPRDELGGLVDMNLKRRNCGQGFLGQISVEESLKMKHSDWRNDTRRYEMPQGIGEMLMDKVSGLAEGIKGTLGFNEEAVKENELGGGMLPKRADHRLELRGLIDMKSKREEMAHGVEGQLPVEHALRNRIDDFNLNRREYQVPGITDAIWQKGHELKEGIMEKGGMLMEKALQWKEGAKEALGMQPEPAHGEVPLHRADVQQELQGVNINMDQKVQQLETRLAHGNESRVE